MIVIVAVIVVVGRTVSRNTIENFPLIPINRWAPTERGSAVRPPQAKLAAG